MTASNGAFAEACTSWLSSLSHCCAPLASCFAKEPSRRCKSRSRATAAAVRRLPRTGNHTGLMLIDQDDEKMSFPIVSEQPGFQPQLPAELRALPQPTGGRKSKSKKSKAFGWSSFSVRGRFGSDASRRPLISAPSNFRHVHSSSFHFPIAQESRNVQPWHLHESSSSSSLFRPLELSIHSNENHMSPILPHFDLPRDVTTPPPAYLPDGPDVEKEMMYQRSRSASPPFNVPRKRLPDSSPLAVDDDVPPQIPPRAPGRARSHTSPEMNRIKERVANAMVEVERLQRQIDDVMERQSNFAGSRPSTAHSVARTVPDLEPMPSIPALPPAAPSFAERLNQDMDRPRTASIKQAPRRPSGAAVSPQPSPGPALIDGPLLPPLPLVLRPPLRKKKSFSRVSSWLFPKSEQDSDPYFHSITTLPRPVKGQEGFYQCVDNRPWRLSCDSQTTVSTWYTNDEDLASPPTACSPESTPVTKECPFLERTATFGKSSGRSSRPGFDVAF